LLIGEIAQKSYYGTIKTVTTDMFPNAADAFAVLGLPFNDFIDIVNEGLKGGISNTTSTTKVAKTFIYVGSIAANEFDVFPERGTPLYDQIDGFLSATVVDPHAVYPLIGHFLSFRAGWALYFWGTAGATLVMLAILSVMKQNPADKYEFASVMSRFLLGFIFMTFSALTSHHEGEYYANGNTAVLKPIPSKAWKVASSTWVIPSFAITLIVINFIDIVLGYYARKQYPPGKGTVVQQQLLSKLDSEESDDKPWVGAAPGLVSPV